MINVYTYLNNKWNFDQIYNAYIARPLLKIGNNIIGKSAVTAIGTTSKTHQIAIQTVMPNSIKPTAFKPPGGSIN